MTQYTSILTEVDGPLGILTLNKPERHNAFDEVLIGEITDKVPADVKAEAEKVRDDIAAGTLHPFTGPINKQDGSPWLAEGATAPDGDLLGMNFFVEGIKGDIPK